VQVKETKELLVDLLCFGLILPIFDVICLVGTVVTNYVIGPVSSRRVQTLTDLYRDVGGFSPHHQM
jgi:hypothetical protein